MAAKWGIAKDGLHPEELWYLDGQGSAEFLFLGETLKPLNDNNVFKPIGRIGSQPCTDGYVVH